jgi:uncharacterized protein YjdB
VIARRVSIQGLALMAMTILFTSCCGQFFKGPQDLAAVLISPNGNTIKQGSTQQFAATGIFQDPNGATKDVTERTTWTSSDPAIVSIDSNGLATGNAFGRVTIKGSCECYNSKAILTVGSEDVNLTSISIDPSGKTIIAGKTQQFTATAEYSNNTTADISSSVTWISSDTSVATVDSTGLATAISSGSTIIRGGSGGISGTTTLSVLPSTNP